MFTDREIQVRALKKSNETNRRKAALRRENYPQPEDPFIRHIPLTKGLYAVVDTFLYDWLNSFNWHAMYSKNADAYYATRLIREDNKCTVVFMHREIVGLPRGSRLKLVDHKNHDTLNNCGGNLRKTDKYGNGANARKKRGANMRGTSPRGNGRFRSYIYHRGQKINLGTHDSEMAAHLVHVEATKKYHGEFACLEHK